MAAPLRHDEIAMNCPACGAENPAEQKFCNECAAPFKRRCAKCGYENPPTAKFCGECATALTSSVSKPTAAIPSMPSVRVAPESSSPEALDGERKTVTALFADIKGSTELEQDLDPEEARAMVDPALRLMIDAVRRYDGYVVQSTGDGIFAIFGAPLAHEDHPQRALYAALRMQEELRRYGSKLQAEGRAPLEIRVGVNTGEVVVRAIATGANQIEYTPIGHTTNLASRLQSIARTGSIVTSEATRRLCEGYFALKPLGPAKVKGVSEPINVYEVTGLGPLRTRLQRAAGRGLTKFVGRESEIQSLTHAAEQARAGHGQIVAAIAEAGTGKSRLFFEFKAKNQSGWMVLEAFSVSHGKASAYLPVLDLLHSYFDIKSEDDARKRREKVNGKIVTLDRSLEDGLPYLFGLFEVVDGEDPLAQMDANIRKRRTMDAIKRILLRESLNQPLMVMFEDLHWIDEQTQEFLNLLADSIATAKILLLVNYRPEYSHQWGNKTYYTQLRLDPLGKESADQMLQSLLGDSSDLAALKRIIVEKTEGNPFFMEETVQVLLDEGALVRNGTTRLVKPLSELKIPPTVQAILAARIDRLPAEAKDLLQTLSVVGRQFPTALIRAIVRKSEDDLDRMLNNLQLGEFIYEQPAVADTEYIFKHALTQEVAYNSVLMERRKQVHERIGLAIESIYAGSIDDHLSELAHHFSRSADDERAVKFLSLAGRQSLRRNAFDEAMRRVRGALAHIAKLPVSFERNVRELELMDPLLRALWVSVAVDAREILEALERAESLAEQTGNLAGLVGILSLRRVQALRSGDYLSAASLAPRILELAEREGNASSLATAYNGMVEARFFAGDLAGAEAQFALWQKFRTKTLWPSITLGTAGICAWMMGRVRLARDRIAEAIALAAAAKDPFALSGAKASESLLYFCLREPENVMATASQSIALSEENAILLMPDSRLLKAWALAQLGKPAEALVLFREDVEYQRLRSANYTYMPIRPEIEAMTGALEAAMDSAQEALSRKNQNQSMRPDYFRIRGEIWLKRGNREAAEADFRQAVALAQQMDAKMFELRAATSLARLLRNSNRRAEARAILSAIYNWFTEGLDTADLKDAKAVLDELST